MNNSKPKETHRDHNHDSGHKACTCNGNCGNGCPCCGNRDQEKKG